MICSFGIPVFALHIFGVIGAVRAEKKIFSDSCLSRFVSNSGLFGTNTAYRLTRNPKAASWIPSGCVPIHLWMYIRHGTRYPKDKKIHRYRERLSTLRNLSLQLNAVSAKEALCSEEYDYLKSWSFFNLSLSLGHHLAEEGEREMESLGRRIRNHFGQYEASSTLFDSTPTERAQKSAEFFKKGFLRSQRASVSVKVKENEGDEVLRPYKTCAYWLENVKHNPEYRAEFRKFRDSEYVSKIKRKFSEVFGLPENIVTVDDVITAYVVCAFESAWNFTGPVASVWCRPFADRFDLEAMEYLEDLHRWHVHAHGHKMNYLLGCGIARSIVGSFRSSIALAFSSASEKKFAAEFHFTHCGALQKLLTRLQLFKDDWMNADDYPARAAERLWKGSQTTPFGANIALVLHSCGASGFKVQTFVNERPAAMPFCGGELCDFETFAAQVGDGYCHLPSLCGLNSGFAYAVAGFLVLCLMFVFLRPFMPWFSSHQGRKSE